MAQGHLIVFEHRNFRGHHRHIFTQEKNFAHGEDSFLNDKISSFIVLDGKWRFYRHKDFGTQTGAEFSAGHYPWVVDVGMDNDDISSVKCVG